LRWPNLISVRNSSITHNAFEGSPKTFGN